MEDVLAIYKEATEAAKTAVEACGPEDTRGLKLRVRLGRNPPARGPFVSFCKRNGIGRKNTGTAAGVSTTPEIFAASRSTINMREQKPSLRFSAAWHPSHRM